MRLARRAAGSAAVCGVLCAGIVGAQDRAAMIGPSAVPTPPVTELTVRRQQAIDVTSFSIADPRSTVLQLAFFPDVSLRVHRTRLEATAHGLGWTGVLDGYPESTALFVSVDDELAGHVYAPFGFFRIVRQPDGGYLVQQVDQSIGSGAYDAVEKPPGGPQDALTAPPGAAGADDGRLIDVLMAYTPDALNGFGGPSRAGASIDLAVVEANQAFRATGLATRLRLVHAVRVDYGETGASATDLARLTHRHDGFVDELHTLRDQYAADLVVLVTERSDVCGRGYVADPHTPEGFGFSVLARSCVRDGRILAHEIGHNLGAHHDWYQTTTPGAFAYSKGYVSLSGRFLDVMAYYDLCREAGVDCQPLLAFSNPAQTHDGHRRGVPAGTRTTCVAGDLNNPPCDADVARTLIEMAPIVARYRDSRTSLAVRQLLPGQSFHSTTGQFRLVYQSDGNLVLYDEVTRVVLWTSGTRGTSPGRAILQSDGNFVVYDRGGAAVWASGTPGHPGAYLVVQNDGNLVIYGPAGGAVWDRHR